MSTIYTEYFGFGEPPFSLAPDPRYLYASEQHREALAHLLYGVRGEGGFVLLTGEVGTGKTTIFRCLLERLPEKTSIAFVLHPRLSVPELLATVCDEFGIVYPEGTESTKTFVDLLNTYLLDVSREGIHAVLVIDEAQNLSVEVLEQLRLLTNLETNRRKLLQIILIGQPELREILGRPDMTQLSQRITARYHLGPLRSADVGPYIEHRLAVAGVERPLFPKWSAGRIHRLSGGVPRLINLICDRALLGTFTGGKTEVTRPVLEQAATEVLGGGAKRKGERRRLAFGAAALLGLGLYAFMGTGGEEVPLEAEVRPDEIVGVEETVKAEEAAPVPVTEPAPVPEAKEEREKPAVTERPGKDLEWLFGQARGDTRGHAAGVVLAAWGVNSDVGEGGDGDGCVPARAAGLRCLSAEGSLDDLRRLNRPAVIRLLDVEGSSFYAALTGADESRVTLVFKGGSGEVDFRWFGSYTVFWRAPPGYESAVHPGQRSALTPWVRERLGRAAAEGAEGELYEPELVEAVRAFQRSRGLEADGIVGPLTLIHLNTGRSRNVPLLRRLEGDG